MYPHIILKSKISSIREVARVIRYMHVASFPRVMFRPLHYRKIKKEKSQALKQCKVSVRIEQEMIGPPLKLKPYQFS